MVAGVTSVVFGAAIWLAILTVVAVSIVYRLVMRWVVDGSGGSGLCEDEFGPWAVKINSSITLIEYTLTFLVSMSALVTFLADRIPVLNSSIAGLPLRSVVAICLSIVVCGLVNRGPKVAAAAFGPATGAVLLFLWIMIGASIYRRGAHLPDFDLRALSPEFLHLTLAGYARILALMTGIEIFANLVSAYDGPPEKRSRQAFGSLVIVMFTTCMTMLIVGPAIAEFADVNNQEVSVFTQTMDILLPPSVSIIGSIVGIAVLLSACAASAQGVQNLSLGLRYRHYLPAWLGRRNNYGVSSMPVWLVALTVIICFFVFGTSEEKYLSLYAAGVFVLLSLTSWAVVKRIVRQIKGGENKLKGTPTLLVTLSAAFLTSIATFVIFRERFTEGAWSYLLLVPCLYLILDNYRRRLGPPPALDERLGKLLSASYYPRVQEGTIFYAHGIRKLLVALDLSPYAELALPMAREIAQRNSASIDLFIGLDPGRSNQGEAKSYLSLIKEENSRFGLEIQVATQEGDEAEAIAHYSSETNTDLIILVAKESTNFSNLFRSNATKQLIHKTTPPLLILRPTSDWRSIRSRFSKILVTLDGSSTAEQVIPFAMLLAKIYASQLTILTVPEGGSVSPKLRESLGQYLENIANSMRQENIQVSCVIAEGEIAPGTAIIQYAKTQKCDLIMMVSHGSGGVERQKFVKLGSVAEKVLDQTLCPLYLVSALPEPLAYAKGERE